jgi:hypothetical protein
VPWYLLPLPELQRQSLKKGKEGKNGGANAKLGSSFRLKKFDLADIHKI